VCPEIESRIASPVLERTAREAMLDVALSLAPRAELADRGSGLFASEGVVYVDASGIEALHGSAPRGGTPDTSHPPGSPRSSHDKKAPQDRALRQAEGAFASMLHARAERSGIHGLVALASSRGVARLAARHLALGSTPRPASSLDGLTSRPETDEYETTRVLAPEQEIDFLSPLPIDLLDPDDRTAQALTRFGLHRVRDLLRLSRRDLAARLGPGLLELVARARGEEAEPPLPEPRTTTIEEGLDLDVPISSLEPLAFVLRGLVSRLIERLTLRGLGCVELRLALQLENGARQSRRIGVGSPSQDERVLLRLLRLALEGEPPSAAVEGLLLLCEGVPLRREQLDLFIPRGPSPSELDQTLAELGSICGIERVGSPEIVDDHRPDIFALKPFQRKKPRPEKDVRAPFPEPSRGPNLRRGPRLTMRALRPPLRADVRLERGRPSHLRSAVSQGEVLTAAGPWRTTGHWWSESAHFAIDHYDIQMSDGTILRLCFDWKTKRWQVDGLYD
jgi:protein ImuB